MNDYLLGILAGLAAAWIVDRRGALSSLGSASSFSAIPQSFFPLETPRATLTDASRFSQMAARNAWLARHRYGLGDIDILIS